MKSINVMMASAIVSGIAVSIAAAQVDGPPSRPNILYVYVDDMGWGSIGPNGQDARRQANLPSVKTPTIDALAATGVNFQRAYGCMVCSPARSSQQTGFHQGHTWADRNNPDNAKKAMRAEDITMGTALKAAGYVTGYWGKWGYGGSQAQNNPVILNVQTLPNSHGYDYVLAELHHVRAHTFFQPTLWAFQPGDAQIALKTNTITAYANNPVYPEYPALQSDPSYPATAYCDDLYAFETLDFVRAQAQEYNASGTPFFALFAAQIPHGPYADIAQLPDWDAAYDGDPHFTGLSNQAKQWAAMVTRIDAHLANLLDALEDPNGDGDTSDSVADNTLVIFQSDNGAAGNNAIAELGSNADLRGRKRDVWEGGIRVPLVMRWPAKITPTSALQAGTNSQFPVDVTDLLPTFCELAGIEIPLGLDGVSLAPTLVGEGHQRPRAFFIHEEEGADNSIIAGDMKLLNSGSGPRLYDLANDQGETTNIAAAFPDLVAELNNLLVEEGAFLPEWTANTYHDWIGADGASASDASNWSDYVYRNWTDPVLRNDGTIYDTDSGPPNAMWVAKMHQSGPTATTAVADADINLLALEIKGTSSALTQTFDVNRYTLTGRNEIRIAEYGCVTLDNGTLESTRWVDLWEDGEIAGAGTIDATLYHAGYLAVTSSNETTIPGGTTELVANGGFEFGSGNPFNATDDWFNYGPDQSSNARNTSTPFSGSYRGIVGNSSSGAISPATNTGHTIQDGDVFRLEFYHAGATGWDIGADTITATLYYIDGSEQTIGSVTVVPSRFKNTGHDLSANNVFNATPGSVGHTLLLRFESATAAASGEWGSLDEVSLTVDAGSVVIPGTRALAVSNNYRATDTASLDITLAGTGNAGEDYALLQVDEAAALAGVLGVSVEPDFQPLYGDSFTILIAAALDGVFANPGDTVTGSDGTLFDIGYTANAVTLAVSFHTASGDTLLDCLSGPAGSPTEGCSVYDLDGDEDVDIRDITEAMQVGVPAF